MKKTEILVLLISIGLTAVVSAIIAVAGSSLVGTFQSWFWLSFMIQVIFFVAWNSYLIQKNKFLQIQEEKIHLDAISKFTTNISCAYCSNKQTVPLFLDQKNTFKCDSCGQTNGIFMQFTATTLTTPIEKVRVPIDNKESFEFNVTNS
jgi:hypothetical protein